MKRLYRSRQSCIIAGVCGGIAEYFNIDPSIVRILAVLLSIGSIGTRRNKAAWQKSVCAPPRQKICRG